MISFLYLHSALSFWASKRVTLRSVAVYSTVLCGMSAFRRRALAVIRHAINVGNIVSYTRNIWCTHTQIGGSRVAPQMGNIVCKLSITASFARVTVNIKVHSDVPKWFE